MQGRRPTEGIGYDTKRISSPKEGYKTLCRAVVARAANDAMGVANVLGRRDARNARRFLNTAFCENLCDMAGMDREAIAAYVDGFLAEREAEAEARREWERAPRWNEMLKKGYSVPWLD